MKDKVNMGIIGTGHMGQYHVNVCSGLHNANLIGIYEASEERRDEIAKRFNTKAFNTIEELLEEVDAIVVAVPTVLHYEISKQALTKGVHVLVEKPMTETVAQAEELVELAKKNGLIFQVGHVERFNGAVLELGKVVENPFLIESRRLAPFSPRISDVGVVLDLMIHDLDIVLNLVGENVKSVNARGCKAFSNNEDLANAVIHFEGGCIANLVASRATQSKIRTLTISQEKAYIILDFGTQDIDIHRQASSAYLMTREELKYKQESFVEKIFVHKDNPLRQEQLHFIACINGEQEPIVSGESDIKTLKIANEILNQVESNL